jgi:hypothetical protein
VPVLYFYMGSQRATFLVRSLVLSAGEQAQKALAASYLSVWHKEPSKRACGGLHGYVYAISN